MSDNGGPGHAPMMTADLELGTHPEGRRALLAELLPLCEPHGLRCRLITNETGTTSADSLVFEHR